MGRRDTLLAALLITSLPGSVLALVGLLLLLQEPQRHTRRPADPNAQAWSLEHRLTALEARVEALESRLDRRIDRLTFSCLVGPAKPRP